MTRYTSAFDRKDAGQTLLQPGRIGRGAGVGGQTAAADRQNRDRRRNQRAPRRRNQLTSVETELVGMELDQAAGRRERAGGDDDLCHQRRQTNTASPVNMPIVASPKPQPQPKFRR